MRALTLYQPWASLISVGAKRVETRGWRTSYRGPLAIHAGRGGARDDLLYEEPFRQALFGDVYVPPARARELVPVGCIVATCLLVDVVPTEMTDRWLQHSGSAAERAFGDFSPGRYAWLLDAVAPLAEPIGCAGALKLWEPEWHPALGEATAQLLDVERNGSARCSRCGCTDNFACEDGCGWAQADPFVCTSCVGAPVVLA